MVGYAETTKRVGQLLKYRDLTQNADAGVLSVTAWFRQLQKATGR